MKKSNKEDLINDALRRSMCCSKKEFFFDERVKSDNHLSVVDLNKSNQSVIRRIRTSNKEFYQFIESYFCNECICYHMKSMIQIPRSVMKKHSIKI
jgi:hypothetical protein